MQNMKLAPAGVTGTDSRGQSLTAEYLRGIRLRERRGFSRCGLLLVLKCFFIVSESTQACGPMYKGQT